MTASFAALAGVLTVTALSAALWPLRRQAPRALLTGLLLLSVAAFALYHLVGTPAALSYRPPPLPHDLDTAITQLHQALRRDPARADGWLLLGRALERQQRFSEAGDAYARALALAPDQPDVLVAAAQARMRATSDRHLDQQAVTLLERALVLQPSQQRARWLLGVAARQAGQPARAVQLWQPLLNQVDADTRASLRQQIELARRDAATTAMPASTGP